MSRPSLDADRRERIRDAFARVPYAHLIGLTIGEMTEGVATVHLNVRDELKQNQGVVHGGAIASLIDTASAFAVITQLEPNEQVTTTDLTIHYLRPIMEGSMTAKARVIRRGRRLFVIQVDVSDDQQLLLATAVTGYIKISYKARNA
jgi:uncharacterized protein (TIGR00369 family)